MDKIILHSDVNNFYASVALCINPQLIGKPMVICGDPEKRHGIVLSKSNEAKKAGIKTGDTIIEAKRKIPNLITVPADYKQYSKFSNLIYNIYLQYTPYVESFGLDECWLDVTGCEKEFGSGENLANIIRERIKNEIGVTISVGVSFTKIFAKLGSDLKKPDAVSVISRDNYKTVAWGLKVEEMLFVGRSVKAKLATKGIISIGDLATYPKIELINMFGKVGEKLHCSANGIEIEKVEPYNLNHLPESVSNGITTEQDICNYKNAAGVIYSLSEIIAYRLRRYGLSAKGISLSVRDNKLFSFTKQEKLLVSTSTAQEIAETALGILRKNYSFSENPPVRSITVGTYKLIPKDSYEQASLFDEEINKNSLIDERVDKLRNKYGFDILKRGIEMDEIYSCDAREIDDGFLPFDKSKNTPNE
jgi:DNA polymerase-4